MKMARIILETFLLFNLVIVPSLAYPFGLNFGFGLRNNDDVQIDEQPQVKNGEGMGNLKVGKETGNEKVENKKRNAIFEAEKLIEKVAVDDRAKLKAGFYAQTCPNAEKIVADALADAVKVNPNAVAHLVRLQFHDCFVVGCDASILLDYSPTGDKVEKSSMFNGQLLKGADIVDDIKEKLEEQCPGIVSCSDTLAFSINEGLFLAGLPRRAPLGGRRDSLYSLASIAEDDNLPQPNWSIERMVSLFIKKGFTIEEMVILLGAHSIGSAHCDVFMQRIFNYKNTRKPDPTLPAPVVAEFQGVCKNAGTPQFRNPTVNFDETPRKLDNLFYKNMLTRNKTVLITDSHLIDDPRTIPIVVKMAGENALWQKRFADAMDKMGALNVLTGDAGEVRTTCRATNN
ncbi:peroxidase 28 [Lathyrus oleraceus]|uniref:Peroxidase n=1 Tax=Pisum sativum TaxID=3888 RepID=A0A9D4YFY9_PEA|nr:peroxidase 28-like [Pisum sativum]KAI5436825.1 hypothetical protein KIW84_023084 [Pisum sativum]